MALGVLEHTAHLPAYGILRHLRQLLTVQKNAAGQYAGIIGGRKSVQQPCEGGFPSAGRPGENHAFAITDGQIDIGYPFFAIGILKRDIFKLYHIRTPPSQRNAVVMIVQPASQDQSAASAFFP